MNQFNVYRFIKSFLGSSLFNIFLVFWTVFFCTACSPLVLLRIPNAAAKIGYYWSCVMIFALRFFCNIRIRVSGTENLPKSSPFIVASKHQSALETIFFLQYFKDPIFILKKELIRIPIYGWYLKAMKMIQVDRKSGYSALKKMMLDVKDVLNTGRILIIFPEGTRVGVGEVAPLQSGLIALHGAFPLVPIIPVFLDSGKAWPKSSWVKHPGVVNIHFHSQFIKHDISKSAMMDYVSHHINHFC